MTVKCHLYQRECSDIHNIYCVHKWKLANEMRFVLEKEQGIITSIKYMYVYYIILVFKRYNNNIIHFHFHTKWKGSYSFCNIHVRWIIRIKENTVEKKKHHDRMAFTRKNKLLNTGMNMVLARLYMYKEKLMLLPHPISILKSNVKFMLRTCL